MIPFPNPNQPLPIKALPALFCNAMCHLRAREDEIPLESLLTDAIAAAANAVHLTYDVRGLDERTMPCTINTLAMVPSGFGKGVSFEYFFKPFQDFDAGLGHQGKELLLLEVSYRALVDHLEGTCHSAAIQDEDGASFLECDLFIRCLNRLAQLWSGHKRIPYKVYRATRFIIDGRCSLGLRIQPKIFIPFLKRTRLASFVQGLWPRAIAACYDPSRFPQPYIHLPKPSPGSKPSDFNDRVTELLVLESKRREAGKTKRDVLELDQDATAFMLELKHCLKDWIKHDYADIEEAARRAWENTLRLAAVFHVMCVGHDEIGKEMVKNAWEIVSWSLIQHRRIFVEALKIPAPTPSSSPATHPCAAKVPRPNDNANRLKQCIQAVVDRTGSEWVLKFSVDAIAHLPDKQLASAWRWLEFNQEIQTQTRGARQLVSISRYINHGAL